MAERKQGEQNTFKDVLTYSLGIKQHSNNKTI